MEKNVKKWDDRKYFNFFYLCLFERWNNREMEKILLFGWEEKWKDRKCGCINFLSGPYWIKINKSDEQKKNHDW